MGVLNWDHYLGGGVQWEVDSTGVSKKLWDTSQKYPGFKELGPGAFLYQLLSFIGSGLPWRTVSSTHFWAALAYGSSRLLQHQRTALKQKDPRASLKWDAVSMTLRCTGTILYSCVWNQRPGDAFWDTKNVRYNFPDVLLERNSPSSGILCSEVSIIPMAPITYCF